MNTELSANTRAKLNNALADLNWYAFRFLKVCGFRIDDKREGLAMANRVIGSREVAPEIRIILEWERRLNEATPDNAEQLCRDCAIELYAFIDTLQRYDSQNTARF